MEYVNRLEKCFLWIFHSVLYILFNIHVLRYWNVKLCIFLYFTARQSVQIRNYALISDILIWGSVILLQIICGTLCYMNVLRIHEVLEKAHIPKASHTVNFWRIYWKQVKVPNHRELHKRDANWPSRITLLSKMTKSVYMSYK